MTPKEKAVELVGRFRNEFKWVEKDHNVDLYRDTRQCALIAVAEITKELTYSTQFEYWYEVKQEIEKL